MPDIGLKMSEGDPKRIIVGQTTKTEVLESMGVPNRLESDRIWVYSFFSASGHVPFMLIAREGSNILTSTISKRSTLLLQFDDDNTVSSVDFEDAETDIFGTPLRLANQRAVSFIQSKTLLSVPAEVRDYPYGLAFESIRVSADGRRLIAAGSEQLFLRSHAVPYRVWEKNLETGAKQRLKEVRCVNVVISPDLTRAACLDNEVRIIELRNGRVIATFTNHKKFNLIRKTGGACLAFDPTSMRVASGGYQGELKIWNSSTAEEILSIDAHDDIIRSVAFSPDGRLLATSDADEFTKIWNAKSGELLATIGRSGGTLEFSGDGQYLGIHRWSHVEVWRLFDTRLINSEQSSIELHFAFLLPIFDQISSLAWPSLEFVTDLNIVAASNGEVVIADYDTRKVLNYLQGYRRQGPIAPTFALEGSAEQQMLVIGTIGQIYAWPLIEVEN